MEQSGFRHEALIYSDPDDFLAATVPFLRGALESGESALVAVSKANTALLEGELGNDARRVRFAEIEGLGRNLARIIPFWRDFVDAQQGRPARGIGEPLWPGRGPAEIDECERHEALLNVAFSSAPAWSLLCPYSGSAFGDEVLEALARSHGIVGRDGSEEQSRDRVVDRDCFAGELTGHPAGAAHFEFDRGRLAEVRRRVARAARAAGLALDRAGDLVIAASELAANSVAHGGGAGTLRLWQDSDCLIVEFEDGGTIEDPLVGRLRPGPTQEGGRGLWLANQLCDLVQIRSGARGTKVRLHAALG